MRYCTGCGEACWNSLRHCVSLIDLFYVFILALLVCVHWDKNDPPHLMTKKVCPRKSKNQLSTVKRTPKTNTNFHYFIHLFNSFCPTSVLVTKVSLGFWEVILKCTAQQKIKSVDWWENHLEVSFEGSCDALNVSHHLSQRRCRPISVIERQRTMHLCVTLLYMFTDIQLSCRTQWHFND